MTDKKYLENLRESIKNIGDHQLKKRLSLSIDVLLDTQEFRDRTENRIKSLKLHDKIIYTLSLTSLVLLFFLLGASPLYYFVYIYSFIIATVFLYRIY